MFFAKVNICDFDSSPPDFIKEKPHPGDAVALRL